MTDGAFDSGAFNAGAFDISPTPPPVSVGGIIAHPLRLVYYRKVITEALLTAAVYRGLTASAGLIGTVRRSSIARAGFSGRIVSPATAIGQISGQVIAPALSTEWPLSGQIIRRAAAKALLEGGIWRITQPMLEALLLDDDELFLAAMVETT